MRGFYIIEHMERKLYQELAPFEPILDCPEVTWNVYATDIKAPHRSRVNCQKPKLLSLSWRPSPTKTRVRPSFFKSESNLYFRIKISYNKFKFISFRV